MAHTILPVEEVLRGPTERRVADAEDRHRFCRGPNPNPSYKDPTSLEKIGNIGRKARA